ncbi:MAG: helix-turn-helix transcriptional regulator, partial [Leucobacter sp.]
RVERAMFLLRDTERTITGICFDVGFGSVGTFSRTFKSIVGQSPSAYRAQNARVITPHCVQLATTRPSGPAAAPNSARSDKPPRETDAYAGIISIDRRPEPR